MAWQIRDLASSNHADVRLFRTADFDCSRSGSLRTVFGTRLRLLFAIGSGFQCRGEKRGPVPDLLTIRRLAGPMRRRCFWIARKPVTIAELEGRTTDSSRRLALRASTIYGSSRFPPRWKTQSLFRHGSGISGTDPARPRIGLLWLSFALTLE